MTDLTALAETLLANFVTVRFPRTELLWPAMDDDIAPATRFRHIGDVLRGERFTVDCYRLSIRAGLVEAGHHQFIDHVEADPSGGWRIHLFLPNDPAIELVATITDGIVGSGDPLGFDPRRFVDGRLARLEKSDRLLSKHLWWDAGLP